MIYIYMDGLKYKHDIFQLVSELLSIEEINFIENEKEIFALNSCANKLILLSEGNKKYGELYFENKRYNLHEEINFEFNSNFTEKALLNNAFKRLVYKLLDMAELINEDVEWGILTGIRPMKIIHKLLEDNLNYDEISYILKKEFLIKEEMINKMLLIAKRQRKYLNNDNNNKINLYIHIPFCPSRCSYCSFSTFVVDENSKVVDKYMDILLYEIEKTAYTFKDKDVKINTIYIGGGTPTSLKKEDLFKIIEKIKTEFNLELEDLAEFTVEAGRPDTITKEYLIMLKNAGVNRISINPQTMNDVTLKRIGRLHDKNLIINAYNLAKVIEFDIINMDVILGLPGENLEEIENTFKEILQLSPDNVTIHSLAIKNGSDLKDKEYKSNEDISKKKLYELLDTYLTKLEMSPYYLYRQKRSFANAENIGYAKSGTESIYNIVMMEEKETVIGLGLGSVSKIVDSASGEIIRIPNFKGMNDYLQRIDELIINKEKVVNKIY